MPSYSGAAVGAFAPGSIHFEWKPNPEVVSAEYLRTAGRLDDMHVPLMASAKIAAADTLERFETQTDPDGGAWEPWSRNYRAYAEAHNIGEILQQTMELEASSTWIGSYPISSTSVFIDTSGWPGYWPFHQLGAERTVTDTGTEDITAEAEALAKSAGITFEHARSEILKEGSGGGRSGSNILPARPFVGPSFDAQLLMIEAFDQWFDNVVEDTFYEPYDDPPLEYFMRRGRRVGVTRDIFGRFTSSQVF